MSAAKAGRNRVRVFIATTEGPVAIQKITAEDPDVPSVACRDGTTEVLAISRDYTRFVDRGTGLVARLTGHGAYRLDLDRPVDGGRSWQLPVLLAHLLDTEGRLAGSEESTGLTLLATGEVDREQRVRPVGRIEEKLSAARALIDGHAEDERPLVVLMPESETSPQLAARLPGGGEGTVRLLAWDRVEDLAALKVRPVAQTVLPAAAPPGGQSTIKSDADSLASLEPLRDPILTRPEPPSAESTGASSGDASIAKRRSQSIRRGAFLSLLLLAVAGTAVAAWWTGPRHWESLRRDGDYQTLDRSLRHALIPPIAEHYRDALRAQVPPPEDLVFALVERRASDGGSCSGRAFRSAGREDLAETPLVAPKPGFFRSERGANLCQAIYRVANEGDRLVYLYFAVRPVLSGRFDEEAPAAFRRAAALPPGASLALELDLDRQPARPLGADLLVLAVPSPAPQLRRAFNAATAGEVAEEESGLLDLTALPGLGLTVKGASHAILR